jgi:hypothetical protein
MVATAGPIDYPIGYDNEPFNTTIVVIDDRHIRSANDLSAADSKERPISFLI